MPTSVQTLPQWAQLALLIVPTASAVFAAFGLLLSFQQSRRANAQARSALVAECLMRFAEDEDIQRAFYAIEYSTFKYGEGFHGSEHEREIDKLLRHFSNIALAWQGGLLSTRDVRPIQYYVLRVVRNPEVQAYLKFIASWSERQKLGEHPYAVLIQLCEKLRN
jgi:N-acetylmuramoyl-L-alanine amidase